MAKAKLSERLKKKTMGLEKHHVIGHLKEVAEKAATGEGEHAAPAMPLKKREKTKRALESELENIKAMHIGGIERRRGSMIGRGDRAASKLMARLEEKRKMMETKRRKEVGDDGDGEGHHHHHHHHDHGDGHGDHHHHHHHDGHHHHGHHHHHRHHNDPEKPEKKKGQRSGSVRRGRGRVPARLRHHGQWCQLPDPDLQWTEGAPSSHCSNSHFRIQPARSVSVMQ